MKILISILGMFVATFSFIGSTHAGACMLNDAFLCDAEQQRVTGQANIFQPGSFMYEQRQKQRYGNAYEPQVHSQGSFLDQQRVNKMINNHQQLLMPEPQVDYSGGCKNKAGAVIAGFLTGFGGPLADVGQTMCR
jgi:hypothetical protein